MPDYRMTGYDIVLTRQVHWTNLAAPGTSDYSEGDPGDLTAVVVKSRVPSAGVPLPDGSYLESTYMDSVPDTTSGGEQTADHTAPTVA